MSGVQARVPLDHRQGLTPWERTAIACWVVAVVVMCTRIVLTPHLHNQYPIFANAAQNWLKGATIYGGVSPDLDYFRYSPLAAALFVPLAELPQSLADVLWRLLNTGVFLAGLVWWGRTVLPMCLSRGQMGLVLLAVMPLALG